MKTKTPHINPTGPIAKTVLMPGDPLRAKYIAETYLEDYQQFNDVRGMLGFTGKYKGHEISVMGSGMGMPSIGIYSYELYKFFGVENIIRIGSAGAYTTELDLFDVVIATSAYSRSSYAKVQSGEEATTLYPAEHLNKKAKEYADQLGIKVHEHKIHSSDVFYSAFEDDYLKLYEKEKCYCVEMESFALFANAKLLNKNAACILTISDSLVNNVETTSEERQTAFNEMMKIALEFSNL